MAEAIPNIRLDFAAVERMDIIEFSVMPKESLGFRRPSKAARTATMAIRQPIEKNGDKYLRGPTICFATRTRPSWFPVYLVRFFSIDFMLPVVF